MGQIFGIVLSRSACSVFYVPTHGVVDRHRFDADSDPDPNFHGDVDPNPDPDPDWHQNDANPPADSFQSCTHVGKY